MKVSEIIKKLQEVDSDLDVKFGVDLCEHGILFQECGGRISLLYDKTNNTITSVVIIAHPQSTVMSE